MKKYEHKKIIELIKAKDKEMLLWEVYDFNLTKEEFFNNLLKNSPKSVKKTVFEKYKYLVFRLAYNPLFDFLILNAVDDINHQRELLCLVKNWANFSYLDTDLESIEKFVKFLRNFNQKEIVRFLKKAIEDDLLTVYVTRVNLFYEKGFEIIDNDIKKSIKFNYEKLKKR